MAYLDLEKKRAWSKEYAKKRWQDPKQREYLRAWREKNRDRINAKKREVRKTKEGKHWLFVWNLKKAGLTLEQYTAAVSTQNGVCAICHNKSNRRTRLHVDHCHKTGIFRGLLCHKCNTAIGLINDSLVVARSIVDYLSRPRASSLYIGETVNQRYERKRKAADGATDPVTVT